MPGSVISKSAALGLILFLSAETPNHQGDTGKFSVPLNKYYANL